MGRSGLGSGHGPEPRRSRHSSPQLQRPRKGLGANCPQAGGFGTPLTPPGLVAAPGDHPRTRAGGCESRARAGPAPAPAPGRAPPAVAPTRARPGTEREPCAGDGATAPPRGRKRRRRPGWKALEKVKDGEVEGGQRIPPGSQG